MSSDSQDGEILTLVANRPEQPPANRTDEAVALGNAYATVKGQRQAENLQLRRKDDTIFAMPYAYRPIPWWHPPDTILLEYPGFFTVALTGKALDELFHRLCDQRVTWIRECDPALADPLPAAVTHIEIIHAYPSREKDGKLLPKR